MGVDQEESWHASQMAMNDPSQEGRDEMPNMQERQTGRPLGLKYTADNQGEWISFETPTNASPLKKYI